MYEYFKGLITEITPYYVVVEVGSIGYRVAMANPFRLTAYQDQIQQLYIYQAVREDDISLYGFSTTEEKQLFQKLISVSGIGPKSALAILAGEDHVGLVNAVESEDFKYLTKFPGVGKKTAQQMILDLKGKLADLMIAGLTDEEVEPVSSSPVQSQFFEEAMSALEALGYSAKELKRIEKELMSEEFTSTDAYLRQGLSLLMKK